MTKQKQNNMRTIKFRAWDKKEKKMITGVEKGYSEEISLAGGGYDTMYKDFSDFFDAGSFELMQYTGLKDKNEKEIYEGDIVKWDDKSDGKYWRTGAVDWKPAHYFIHDVISNQDFDFGAFIYEDEPEELEVIGNIYENSTLLT